MLSSFCALVVLNPLSNENAKKLVCALREGKERLGEKREEVERHGCSFKHNSITVGGCCEEEPLEV